MKSLCEKQISIQSFDRWKCKGFIEGLLSIEVELGCMKRVKVFS